MFQLFATLWTAAHQASLSFNICQSLLKLMSTESVMPSNHLILCRPLLLLCSIFPSIRVFSNESVLHIWWQSIRVSASASVLPMNIWGWISSLIDWFDFFAVQGTLKVLSSTKTSILQCSGFFMVQLSKLYMTTRKIIALTICIFVGFPGGTSGKEPACQCRRRERHGFNPWVRKTHWSRKRQPTPVFLPGKSHEQRSLAGYSP